jgi:hypothetical protein
MPKIDKIQLQQSVDKGKLVQKSIEHLFNDYEFECEDMKVIDVMNLLDTLLQSAQAVLSGEYVQRDTLASFQSAVAWMREFMPLVLKKKLLELGYVEKSELTNVVGEFLCDKYGEMRKSSIHIQNVRELVDLISGGKNE